MECTRDALADRIGRDVASVAANMPSNQLVVLDPFAGSCNTLFWILRHLPNSEGIGFESDPQVFELTSRNLATLKQRIELVQDDYDQLLAKYRLPEGRGIVAFVAPPWGTALDEMQGLHLCRTTPPIGAIIEELERRFSKYKMLFAIQVYDKVSTASLNQIRTMFDWTELRIYNINEKGRNHGVVGGAPRRIWRQG